MLQIIMADAQDSDDAGATSAAKEAETNPTNQIEDESKFASIDMVEDTEFADNSREETDGQAAATFAPQLEEDACSLSPSNTSAENPLENNDSGIMLEKSPPVPSPEAQLTTNDSGIALANPGAEVDSDFENALTRNRLQAVMPRASELEQSNDMELEEEAHDSDELEAITVRTLRRNRDLLDSSSEDEGSHTSGPDAARTENEEESDDDDEAEALAASPKDTWRPFSAIASRELGASSRHYSSFLLRESTGASINLVRRLKLHSKLNHHEGCVNSLHFNSSGNKFQLY